MPDLAVAARLDLLFTTDSGAHALRTTLERHDGKRLVVAWPVEHLRLYPLRAGQMIVVEVTRADDALYSIETVLESASTEEPPSLALRCSGDWQRVQRRQTHRFPVEMRASEAMRFAADGDRLAFQAEILDLSTGGMRVRSGTELTAGDELDLVFGTPSGGAQLRLRVNVLRVSKMDGNWEAGCQFVESSQHERGQIVQFILAQQNAISRSA
jgi:c-di-GMP-binding flagellar brake protein YcgR